MKVHALCPHGAHWYNASKLLDVARVGVGDGVDRTGVGSGGVEDGNNGEEGEGEEEEEEEVLVGIVAVEVHRRFRLEST